MDGTVAEFRVGRSLQYHEELVERKGHRAEFRHGARSGVELVELHVEVGGVFPVVVAFADLDDFGWFSCCYVP
eukprot:5338603-Lingulodinium_polyedra.AAC.1